MQTSQHCSAHQRSGSAARRPIDHAQSQPAADPHPDPTEQSTQTRPVERTAASAPGQARPPRRRSSAPATRRPAAAGRRCQRRRMALPSGTYWCRDVSSPSRRPVEMARQDVPRVEVRQLSRLGVATRIGRELWVVSAAAPWTEGESSQPLTEALTVHAWTRPLSQCQRMLGDGAAAVPTAGDASERALRSASS